MKKVLFTDLVGTLICRFRNDSIYYYHNLEKEIALVSRYFHYFLEEGNDIVVVTEPNAHNNPEFVFSELCLLHDMINPKYRTHLSYYFVTNQEHTKKEMLEKQLKVNQISSKKEAVENFLKTDQHSFLYGIGDSMNDIEMLLRIHQLGGNSSFMDLDLYRVPITMDEVIEKQLKMEFSLSIKNILARKTIEEKMNDCYSQEEINLLQARNLRRQELYQQAYNGDIDLDHINRKYSIYSECDSYYYENSFGLHSLKNYKDIFSSMMELSCYSSFPEYYTKVLKR